MSRWRVRQVVVLHLPTPWPERRAHRDGCVTCFRPWCKTSRESWPRSRECSPPAGSTSTASRWVKPRIRTSLASPSSVMGDHRHLEQVRKQLEKLVPVVKVHDISREDYVERNLMLIKIKAPTSARAEIQSLVQIFRGRIVDVSPDQLMVEISGQEKKIEAFIEAVRHHEITSSWHAPAGSPWCEARFIWRMAPRCLKRAMSFQPATMNRQSRAIPNFDAGPTPVFKRLPARDWGARSRAFFVRRVLALQENADARPDVL